MKVNETTTPNLFVVLQSAVYFQTCQKAWTLVWCLDYADLKLTIFLVLTELLKETQRLVKEKLELHCQADKDRSNLLSHMRVLEMELEDQMARNQELLKKSSEMTDFEQQIQALEKQLKHQRQFMDVCFSVLCPKNKNVLSWFQMYSMRQYTDSVKQFRLQFESENF